MNADIGPGGLDRTHILSFGGAITITHGPQVAIIGHYASPEPTDLVIDDQGGGPGSIYTSDVDGDGQAADLMPGTRPGAYMRDYGPNDLNHLIDNYNTNFAGQLTPAGQALVSQGLFTNSQLVALGAVLPELAKADSHAFPNSPLRTLDARVAYSIHPKWFPEQMNLQPAVSMYNVLNMGNFSGPTGTILTPDDVCSDYPACLSTTDASTGYVNTPYNSYAGDGGFGVKNGYRTSRKTGTFDQGAPRATEFSLKFNF
jgi:hypothetical protein